MSKKLTKNELHRMLEVFRIPTREKYNRYINLNDYSEKDVCTFYNSGICSVIREQFWMDDRKSHMFEILEEYFSISSSFYSQRLKTAENYRRYDDNVRLTELRLTIIIFMYEILNDEAK